MAFIDTTKRNTKPGTDGGPSPRSGKYPTSHTGPITAEDKARGNPDPEYVAPTAPRLGWTPEGLKEIFSRGVKLDSRRLAFYAEKTGMDPAEIAAMYKGMGQLKGQGGWPTPRSLTPPGHGPGRPDYQGAPWFPGHNGDGGGSGGIPRDPMTGALQPNGPAGSSNSGSSGRGMPGVDSAMSAGGGAGVGPGALPMDKLQSLMQMLQATGRAPGGFLGDQPTAGVSDQMQQAVGGLGAMANSLPPTFRPDAVHPPGSGFMGATGTPGSRNSAQSNAPEGKKAIRRGGGRVDYV